MELWIFDKKRGRCSILSTSGDAHPLAPLPGADSPYQGEMSRRDKRGRDAVSRRLTERSSPASEYFRWCALLGSPSRGAGSAQPRLRGCYRFATAGCLRRPLLFRLAGKEGGEKGRLVTVWCILHLNLGKALVFRCRSTRWSPYERLTTRRLIRGYQVCN